ncbi:family 78 glycoside hydrolase catalytic domain [Haloferula chungangensis]|uniref:alpha-L-rhamnosidase n=1 Tax=Haloferula chungangensis TaxID=1048331 RepID=A0ABW2L3X8_9BACT
MNPLQSVILSLLAVASTNASPVESMRVEGREAWVVTDHSAPRLEWTPATSDVTKWELQTVVGDEDYSGPKSWKPEPFAVSEGPWKVWQGPTLADGDKARWRVRAIDKNGEPGPWSDEQRFERGHPGKWITPWIGMDPKLRGAAAPMFRKEFNWTGTTKDARLYISGLGYHETWLNGVRLGDGVLEPGQTDYDQRVFYVTHDVEKVLHTGVNILAVRVGDGFYNQDKVWGTDGMSYGEPRLCARLIGSGTDGAPIEIRSDSSWKCRTGAILSSNIYHGEVHDARLRVDGWTKTGFDDSSWHPVVEVPAPGGVMEAESLPPIVRQPALAAKSMTEPAPGIRVLDFGQNFTGWCRLKVQAPAGTRINLTFAERLGDDGRVDTLSTGTIHTKADQRDVYICAGRGTEIWEPSFTWHGFQFVEIAVENGEATSLELEGIPLHTRLPIRGEFQSSDPLVNRLLDTAHWTQVSNVLALPMDCPARERCGWTGDAHLCVPFTMYRYDSMAMWRKYVEDIKTTAERTQKMLTFGAGMGDRKVRAKVRGIPTMVAPGKRFIGEASPDWGSAIVFIPWDLYQFSGDERVLTENLEHMRLWTDHVAALADDKGIVNAGLGDWCRPRQPGETGRKEPRDYYGEVIPMLSTACLFRCADIMADTEALVGDPAKIDKWRSIASQSREGFFLAMDQHEGWTYQTIMAIAIEWGVAPPKRRKEIADRLAEQVKADGSHFMTGVFGSPSLWPALADHGHEDLADSVLRIETAPGFKYLFAQGATSFWEVWPDEGDKGQRWERSMSHPFQGAFAHWFYSGLAGIRIEEPGFKSFRLQPVMTGHLDSVDCRFRSAMGWIESSWKRNDGTLNWTIEVPPGASATLVPPGEVLAWAHDEKEAKVSGGNYTLPSGRHSLRIRLDASVTE